jgi:hypothetical protein
MPYFDDSNISLLSFVSRSTRGGFLARIEQRCDEDEEADTPILCPTRQPSAKSFPDASEHTSEKSVPVLPPTTDVPNEDVDDDDSFCNLQSLGPKIDGFLSPSHHESSKMSLDGDTLTALASCQVFGRDRPVQRPWCTVSSQTMDGGLRRPERSESLKSLDPIAHDVVRSDVRITMAGIFPAEQSSREVPVHTSRGSSVASLQRAH